MPSTFILPGQDREAEIRRITELLYAACPGRRVKVVVSEYKHTRTQKQNNSIWRAYRIIADATGNDVEDLHAAMCGEFFGWKEVLVLGAPKQVPIRTTTKNEDGEDDVIDKLQARNFFTFIQWQATQLGIDVPDPEPDIPPYAPPFE